jgi:hypothetical protein
VRFVELVTIIWRNVEEDNPCNKIHPRRRLKVKVISQRKGKGGMTRGDRGSKMGTRHSALIVVRMDIRLRSVGHLSTLMFEEEPKICKGTFQKTSNNPR